MEGPTLEPGGIDGAYRDLALSQASLSSIDGMRPLGGVEGTKRSFNTILASAEMLGIEIDKSNPIMRGILSALITAEVSGNVIQAAKAIVAGYQAREAAEAATLTAANAAIPGAGWAKIALATGAALMVGAAFGVGFHLGSGGGGGADTTRTSSHTLTIDISDPVARRAAIRSMR